eukprot:TRINITY_DN2986_c1_g1_i1.p2 TRINITY_DN2986_c1_g1~~TRINITY_DN2986_c1_g1_i1.p2  ORF type:complete len:614 (-),score=146.38 TRINITY_DN2986_c1_g1_i1:2188-3948(-)
MKFSGDLSPETEKGIDYNFSKFQTAWKTLGVQNCELVDKHSSSSSSSSSISSAYTNRQLVPEGFVFEDELSYSVVLYPHPIFLAKEYVDDKLKHLKIHVGCGGATFPCNLFLDEDRKAVCADMQLHVNLETEKFILFACEGKPGNKKESDQNKLVIESISALRHNQITRKAKTDESSHILLLPTLYFHGPTCAIGEIWYDVLDHTPQNKPSSVSYTEYNTTSQFDDFMIHLDRVMKTTMEGLKWVFENTETNDGLTVVYGGKSDSTSKNSRKRKRNDDGDDEDEDEDEDKKNKEEEEEEEDGQSKRKQRRKNKKGKSNDEGNVNKSMSQSELAGIVASVCPSFVMQGPSQHFSGSKTWEIFGKLDSRSAFCKVTTDTWETGVFQDMLSNKHPLASCPRIVQPFCAGVDKTTGMGVIVMPWLSTVTGFNIINDHGSRLMDRIEQLRECVFAIHKCGYLHGDIKPDNIGIDSKNQMFLFDLGTIKRVGTRGTRKWKGRFGTEKFMAPEIDGGMEGGEYDETVDYYSAGKTIEHWMSKHEGFKVDPLEGKRKLIARLIEHLCADEPERRDWPTLEQVRRESGGSEGSGS